MRTKEQERLRGIKRYKENKEIFKARAKKWRAEHLVQAKANARKTWERIKGSPERYDRFKQQKKKLRQAMKLRVFDKYGGAKCACCGETMWEFLTIDHIDGGGTKHRKKAGADMYKTLVREKYPVGYQVLCYNCNCAKGAYGKCPHKK